MSRTKSKQPGNGRKNKHSDVLTKVKAAGVTKPAKSLKSKSKELAKEVALKEEKKNKKKAKKPTPEPSSEEEESEEDSEASVVSSDESESDSEVETKKPVVNGKTNGVKVAAKIESSEESDEDSLESDSETEAPVTNGTKVAPAADSDASSDESDDESGVEVKGVPADESEDSSSESESEDEQTVKKTTVKAVGVSAKSKKVEPKSESEADSDSGEDSEEDSEDSGSEEDNGGSGSDEDSEDSGASEESEVEVKKITKRKAEEEEPPITKKTKTEMDTSRGANLFIGNLSWNVDEAWLQDEFQGYGELNGVRLMTDRQTGRSKGFAYVEFVNAADAAKAHADKQGVELDGRVMNVDFANARPNGDQKQENRRKSYGDQVSEPSDTLFVGNLSFDVGQDAVSQAFAPHGTVMSVRLPTDRDTGNPKGFGYVTFASVEEAQSALEAMQGFYIEKRPVRLDFSQPRPQQGDSPARGGFGGRGRGGFGGGRGGGRGRGGGDFRGGRGGARGGRGGSTNRGGFGDYSGKKTTF